MSLYLTILNDFILLQVGLVGRVKVVVHRVYEAVEVEDVNEKDPFNVGNRTCVPPVSETESEEPVQTEENVSIP